MTIDNPEVIDFIGTLNDGSAVVLTLVDHWTWAEEMPHLLALQTKMNTYLDFIESGQIFEDHPDAIGREVIIDLIVRCPIPELGLAYLEYASQFAAALPARITHHLVGDLNTRFPEPCT